MTSKELNEILNKTRRTPNVSLTPEQVEELVKDLEQKEKQDKILERLMFYSERKKLGEEFLSWALENKVDKNDLTNIITWCFCIKLRSWLDNEKEY